MTTPSDRRILLSVKPPYADAILAGSKTVELRRVAPQFTVPTEVLLYASSPVSAIVGRCRAINVLAHKPRGLWRLVGPQTGVTFEKFSEYFEGCDTAFGIVVEQATRLQNPIGLAAIRNQPGNLQPPQSYRYLSRSASDQLLALAG